MLAVPHLSHLPLPTGSLRSKEVHLPSLQFNDLPKGGHHSYRDQFHVCQDTVGKGCGHLKRPGDVVGIAQNFSHNQLSPGRLHQEADEESGHKHTDEENFYWQASLGTRCNTPYCNQVH